VLHIGTDSERWRYQTAQVRRGGTKSFLQEICARAKRDKATISELLSRNLHLEGENQMLRELLAGTPAGRITAAGRAEAEEAE
jgi:hypothetical protein